MMRIFVTVFISLGLATAQAEISVIDDTGATVRLATPARRIVSLAPHVTESLFAAGAGAVIVGTVEHSDYPEAALKLPRVGGYSRLDLEAVAALRPDLVIAWQSGNANAHLERLRALGLPIYLSQPGRIEDIARSLENFGRLAGTETVARQAAQSFRARHAALQQRYANRAPVRVFYQVWRQPLTTIGGKQIISDAIRLCGGINVFGDLTALAPIVTAEAVLATNPEAIIASGMGEERPEWLDDWKRWTQLTAVTRSNLFFIPPALIQRHTPRLLDGTEKLCAHLDTTRAHRPAGGAR